jgi:hypothetical protein
MVVHQRVVPCFNPYRLFIESEDDLTAPENKMGSYSKAVRKLMVSGADLNMVAPQVVDCRLPLEGLYHCDDIPTGGEGFRTSELRRYESVCRTAAHEAGIKTVGQILYLLI